MRVGFRAVLVAALVALFGFSSILADTWVRTIDRPADHRVVAAQPTLDDRFLVVAREVAAPGTTLLARLNADGSVLWLRRIEGGGVTHDAAEAADGGLWLAGESSPGGGFPDATLLRLDSAGRSIAEWATGGPGTERANGVLPTSDGGVLIVGQTDSWGAGGTDGLLLRFDRWGTLAWSRVYGTPEDDALYAARQLADGSFVAVGSGGSEGLMLRLDAAGWIVWERRLPPGECRDVALASDGGFVAILDPDQLIKLDVGGTVTWHHQIGDGVRPQVLRSLTKSADGVLATTGSAGGDLWYARVSNTGFPQWQMELRTGDVGSTGAGRGIGRLSDRGFFVAGDSDGQMLALRLNESGGNDGDCSFLIGGVAVVSPRSTTGVPAGLQSSTATGISVSTASSSGAHLSSATSTLCLGTKRRTPSEVSPPAAFDDPLRFTGPDELAWEPPGPSAADQFTLYRGDLADLPAGGRLGECLLENLTTAAATDPEQPTVGAGWFYVTRGRNSGGRGTVGTASSGERRITGRPCNPFASCGELKLGFHCTPLLETVDPDPLGNRIFFVETLDGFGVGDTVSVDGEVVAECLELCPYPCIVDNTIEADPDCGTAD